jgi:chromate transport protein ChrA
VAFTLPTFIVIVILSTIYFKAQTLWFIEALFKGLGAIVVAIVLNACITLGRSIFRDWKVALISFLSFFAFFFRWNVILIFILAAGAALLLHPKGSKPKPPSHEELNSTTKKGKDYLILGPLIILVYLGLVLCYVINPQLTYLSLTLSKIGALAFGGGFTMIPLNQYEVVDHFHWLTTKEFLDGIALGQITPGPIMINDRSHFYWIQTLRIFWSIGGNDRNLFFLFFHSRPSHSSLRSAETSGNRKDHGTRNSWIIYWNAWSGTLQFWKNSLCGYSEYHFRSSGFHCPP